MMCPEAREWLSAYIDEALAPEERLRVEAHLASCPECQRELATLRRTVSLLQRVQPARAPAGFADRVLAAARGRPWYRRVADAVLFPLPAKLPLHATAAVMIGLLAVYLVERTPELQQAARQEAPRPDGFARERSAAPGPRPPDAPARAGGERDRRDASGLEDAAPPVASPPSAAPAPPGAAPAPELRPAPPPRSETPGEKVGAATRSEAERQPPAPGRGGDPARGSPSSQRLAAKRAEPSADVVARGAVRDRDAAERELTELIARMDGTVAQRRSEEVATVIEAVIPEPRYAEFSESLARIGAWQVEAARPDLPARVRVILRLH
jgi:hypothetical protein